MTAKTCIRARNRTRSLNKTLRNEKLFLSRETAISVIHLNRFQSKDYLEQTSHQVFSIVSQLHVIALTSLHPEGRYNLRRSPHFLWGGAEKGVFTAIICVGRIIFLGRGSEKGVFTFVHSESDFFRIEQVKAEDERSKLLNLVIN